MNISDTDVRNRLLTIFEECRQEPSSPYDEQRFLDHLIEPPSKHGEIKSRFAGNRRFNRFIDKVQTEYSVYFSQRDWETNFSVDRFVQRIQKLRQRPNGSLRSLKNAMTQSDSNAVIFVNVVLLLFVAMSRNVGWLFVVTVALWLGVNGWLIWFYRRERKRLKSLLKQIEELKSGRADFS